MEDRLRLRVMKMSVCRDTIVLLKKRCVEAGAVSLLPFLSNRIENPTEAIRSGDNDGVNLIFVNQRCYN